MSKHHVTVVGPHQSQKQLFTILEANRQLRPIHIFAVSGTSSAVRLILEQGSEAVERFLETIWTHDPSAVEAISITTYSGFDVSGEYSVHHPGATGWKPVIDALTPSPEAYFLEVTAPAELVPELLTDLSNRFTDVTDRTLPSSGIEFGGGKHQNVSVRMECSLQETADILSPLASEGDVRGISRGTVISGRDPRQKWSVENLLQGVGGKRFSLAIKMNRDHAPSVLRALSWHFTDVTGRVLPADALSNPIDGSDDLRWHSVKMTCSRDEAMEIVKRLQESSVYGPAVNQLVMHQNHPDGRSSVFDMTNFAQHLTPRPIDTPERPDSAS